MLADPVSLALGDIFGVKGPGAVVLMGGLGGGVGGCAIAGSVEEGESFHDVLRVVDVWFNPVAFR